MTEEFIFNTIANIGVPAVICLYTLVGVNKSLKELTNAINRLSGEVDKRITKLEEAVDDLKRRQH